MNRKSTKGRPRQFRLDEALETAMEIFWRQGYLQTGVRDITEALGIERPSLYAAFGNKEQLFLQAFECYKRSKLGFIADALEAATIREVVEKLMRGAVNMQVDENGTPRGCMSVNSAMSNGAECERIRGEAFVLTSEVRQAVFLRFTKAHEAGEIPEQHEPAYLTSYVLALLQGLSVQGSMATSREELDRVVETSLSLWPTL